MQDQDLVTLIDLIEIPAGRFLMGSSEDESGHYDDEGPQHEVTFTEPFFLGRYPVTQAQWRAVAALPRVNRDLNPDPAYFKGDDRPVEQVSWLDAQEFCDRLSEATGSFCRLPTEAEWEYACRAGTTTPFHFGQTPDTTLLNCYMPGSAQATTPVGSFPSNSWGLHDMHGNVWEWCLDEYHKNYEGAPTDGSPWVPEEELNYLVMRGGSWNHVPGYCRSAGRRWLHRDDLYRCVGFRVLRGGSWYNVPRDCRFACRLVNAAGTRSNAVGFRVVRGGSWGNVLRDCRSACRFINAAGTRFDIIGFRVTRGGSWLNGPASCRSANRDDWYESDSSDSGVGFRVACEAGGYEAGGYEAGGSQQ